MKKIQSRKIAVWLGMRDSMLSLVFAGKRRVSPVEAHRLASVSGIDYDMWRRGDPVELRIELTKAYTRIFRG